RDNDLVRFSFDSELRPQAGSWSNYPMTVARRLALNFPGASRGADIALLSDLPFAAGMSSSSALLVGISLILAQINRLAERDEYRQNIHCDTDLAGYLGTVENGLIFGTLAGFEGVGTFGGSEDQTAILCAKPSFISQYSYCPVVFQKLLPVPQGHVFAVGVSGCVAEKTGAALEKYNSVSRLASFLAELWRRETDQNQPHLAAILNSAPDAADRLKSLLKTADLGHFDRAALDARLEHFYIEDNEIIPAVDKALEAGDLPMLGSLVDRSQRSAELLLGNQIPETMLLAASARRFGAAAAS
ncbi:MAG: GHMP family kinase ATP-binding protein, partial [Thermoguttaceae bacterium]